MNAKDIITKRFDKATFSGYKTEDVDEFLKDVSFEFDQLKKEKNELERKLEVLADKIREYRNDEEALKDALLGAQKQGNLLINDAKAQAEKLTKETKEANDKSEKETADKISRMKADAEAYSKKTISDANAKSEKIVSEARAKADDIHNKMMKQTEIEQNILQRTRKEVEEFRNRLLSSYQNHIDIIKTLPEKCENEFVRTTALETEKRNAERKAAPQKPVFEQPKPVQQEIKPVESKAEEKNTFVEEDEAFMSIAEEEAPVEKKGLKGDKQEVPEIFKNNPVPKKDGSPFFALNGESDKQKFDNLQFGSKK